MIDFHIENEVFIGLLMIIVVPVVLWINKKINGLEKNHNDNMIRLEKKIDKIINSYESDEKAWDNHLRESDMDKEKLEHLQEKVSLNTNDIQRMKDDISTLFSLYNAKKSPV